MNGKGNRIPFELSTTPFPFLALPLTGLKTIYIVLRVTYLHTIVQQGTPSISDAPYHNIIINNPEHINSDNHHVR